MKLTKFGTLVNKTTYLFTSIRVSNISRGCAKILANPFRGGAIDISGTKQLVQGTRIRMGSNGWFRGE